MSRFSDDFDDMDAQGVRHGAGDVLGAADEVTRFLTELRALGDGPPPTPSAELAALLGGATPLFGRRALVRTAVRTGAIAAILLGVLVVAAASHSLPSPAQRVVSNVVNVLTPFHIGTDHPQPMIEPPRPSDKPTPTQLPSPSPSPTPTRPRTTAPVVGGEDDGRNGGGDGRPGSGDDGRGVGGGDDAGRSSSGVNEGGSDDGGARAGGSDGGGGSDDGPSSSPRTSPSPSRSSEDDHSGGGDGSRDDG